jgi:hypothetical protein
MMKKRYRGEPVAEVGRIDESARSLSDRLDDLERSGILTPSAGKGSLKPLARKRGTLKRFLKSRE